MSETGIGLTGLHVLELIPDALFIIDDAGVIIFANQPLNELFGYAHGELIGRGLDILIPEQLRVAHSNHVIAYVHEPYVRPMGTGLVFEAHHRSERDFPVEIYLNPLRAGESLYVMGAVRDIRERVALEDELRRSRDELEARVQKRTAELEEIASRLQLEKDEHIRTAERIDQLQDELSHISRLSTIGEMATGLGHELNQPLAAIVNYAQGCIHRLQSGGTDPGILIDVMQKISRQASHGSEIVGRFRRFAKKQKLHREWVNVDTLLFDAFRMVEPDVMRHGIATDFRVSGLLPQIFVDPVQLQQVLINLVLNAIEAMLDQPEDDRCLHIHVTQVRATDIEISVIDTGHGLKAASVQQLFDPFFTMKPDGLGMGLYLSQRIVEAHGGTLHGWPNEGSGMTFRVVIPASAGNSNGE